MDLLSREKVGRDWPARVAGTEQWFHLSSFVPHAEAFASAAAASANTHAGDTADHSPVTSGAAGNGSPASDHAPAFGEDETVIASIGQKALVGLLKGDGISSTQVVLTEKRIYVRGRAITRSSSEQIRMMGDLPSICSLSLHNHSSWAKLAVGIILFVVAIFLATTPGFGEIMLILAGVTFFIATMVTLSFFLGRRRYLRINMHGTPYDVSMQGVNDDLVLAFMDTSMAYLSRPGHHSHSTHAARS